MRYAHKFGNRFVGVRERVGGGGTRAPAVARHWCACTKSCGERSNKLRRAPDSRLSASLARVPSEHTRGLHVRCVPIRFVVGVCGYASRESVRSRPFDTRLALALAFRNTRVGLSFPVPAAADRAHVICPFRVVVIGIIERGRMIGIGGDDDSSRSVEHKIRARRCSMIIFFISS